MPDKTCQNCGDNEDTLFEVYRIYLKLDLDYFDPDMSKIIESKAERQSEMWCSSCCNTYPNLTKSD